MPKNSNGKRSHDDESKHVDLDKKAAKKSKTLGLMSQPLPKGKSEDELGQAVID